MVTKKTQVQPTPTTDWPKVIKVALGGTAIALLVFLAFVWPNTTAEVKNIELAVAGPPAQSQLVSDKLSESGNVFKPKVVADRDAAVKLIKEREVSGAVVLGRNIEVLTASANSPVLTQILGQLPVQIQNMNPDVQVTTTDVVPLIESDKRGTGLTSTALPLVFAGIVGGILVSLLVIGKLQKIATVTLYALLAGLVVGAVVRFWLDLLPGNYFAISSTIALAVLATSALIIGLSSMLERPGIGVGVALTMLIANPLSAAALPVQFLAEPWGDLGQLLVPGAGITLLRNVSYFPDASIVAPLSVLLCWIALGFSLVLASKPRRT